MFALTVHLLLESQVALWLWNHALFDCQPREKKSDMEKNESSNNYRAHLENRIVLCSDKQMNFNKIFALDTHLVTPQVLIYYRVKNLL